MKAAEAFEVVATGAGLIEWFADELLILWEKGAIDTIAGDIWQTADAIRSAVNGSVTWEETEKTIIAIRRRHEP